MKVEQIYTGCLAHGAYYIESNGEVAIIDPLREVDHYIERAAESEAKIKYVLETHFHADFVSGHVELANKTGAQIVFGPNAMPGFKAHIAKDGEELAVGDVVIKVLHTPGHTMESTTYLLRDEVGKDYAIFTGDTLFIGDVGRPDLVVKNNLTREDLAGYLYDSLQTKILPLSDSIIIYPGHGAGSACGKNMSSEKTDTLGNQKIFNYALRKGITKQEFIKEVTDGLLPPPAYFPMNVKMNREGYESMDIIMERGLHALSNSEFETVQSELDALIIDTRRPEDYVKGFIPSSINIGIDGGFAPWVGTLLTDNSQPILVVADEKREKEVVTRLARVGYDYVIGFLKGGFNSWKKEGKIFDCIDSITPIEFEEVTINNNISFIDVRKYSEFDINHVEHAINVPLEYMDGMMNELNKDKTLYLYCAGGYRSAIAASILKSRGYDNIINIEGGFNAISKTKRKLVH